LPHFAEYSVGLRPFLALLLLLFVLPLLLPSAAALIPEPKGDSKLFLGYSDDELSMGCMGITAINVSFGAVVAVYRDIKALRARVRELDGRVDEEGGEEERKNGVEERETKAREKTAPVAPVTPTPCMVEEDWTETSTGVKRKMRSDEERRDERSDELRLKRREDGCLP